MSMERMRKRSRYGKNSFCCYVEAIFFSIIPSRCPRWLLSFFTDIAELLEKLEKIKLCRRITSAIGKSVSADSPVGWRGSQRPSAAVYSAIPVLRRSQIDTVHVTGTSRCYPSQFGSNGDIVLRNVVRGRWLWTKLAVTHI